MEEYGRSRSYKDGRNMQIEVYGNNYRRDPSSSYDLRSYSTNSSVYQSSSYDAYPSREMKLKKGKSISAGVWGLNDPELQRKKRVAGYKVYAVEGKVKGSFRKSFRWLKDRYTHVVYGWW